MTTYENILWMCTDYSDDDYIYFLIILMNTDDYIVLQVNTDYDKRWLWMNITFEFRQWLHMITIYYHIMITDENRRWEQFIRDHYGRWLQIFTEDDYRFYGLSFMMITDE